MELLLTAFDNELRKIDRDSRGLLSKITDEQLFRRPSDRDGLNPFSCGEYILRSAAMVEKTFGGITTRLWDDPFEWTLPEKLSDRPAISGYLDEVEATRAKAFATFTSDADLLRQIPSPEKLRTLSSVILESIGLARHYQGRAFAIFQVLSDATLPRL